MCQRKYNNNCTHVFTDAVIFIELEVHLRGSTIQNAAYGVALYYCLQKFYCHCIVVYSTV